MSKVWGQSRRCDWRAPIGQTRRDLEESCKCHTLKLFAYVKVDIVRKYANVRRESYKHRSWTIKSFMES